MAAKGRGGAAASNTNSSNGGEEEETAKRPRGRPRKTAGGETEANAMRKFLRSGEEAKAFEKSSIVRHTPEKNTVRKEKATDKGDGKEENTSNEGEKGTSGGSDKEREEDSESAAERGSEKDSKCSDESDGRGVTSGREETARDDDEAADDETKAGDGVAADDDEENDRNRGMSASGERWMRVALRMNELGDRLEKALIRVERKEKEAEKQKEICKCSCELVIKLEAELVSLRERQNMDRLRISDLESKLDEMRENRDKNWNIERGVTGGVSAEDKRKVEDSERGGGGHSLAIERETEESAHDTMETEKSKEGTGSGGGSVIEDRSYFHCFPTPLSEGEYRRELEERKGRKKNLMIRGIRTVGKGLQQEVKNVVRDFLGIEIYIKKVEAVEGGLVVELESFSNKIDILKRKGKLRGINLWIEEDLTCREREVQGWLKQIAEEEAKRGFETKVGYQKVMVDGEWYRWDDREGNISQMDFQERKEGKNSE